MLPGLAEGHGSREARTAALSESSPTTSHLEERRPSTKRFCKGFISVIEVKLRAVPLLLPARANVRPKGLYAIGLLQEPSRVRYTLHHTRYAARAGPTSGVRTERSPALGTLVPGAGSALSSGRALIY